MSKENITKGIRLLSYFDALKIISYVNFKGGYANINVGKIDISGSLVIWEDLIDYLEYEKIRHELC